MNNFIIEHQSDKLTIHTTTRNNKELAGIIGKIDGVKHVGGHRDYEMSVYIAKCFDKETMAQLIKKEVNLYYKKKEL